MNTQPSTIVCFGEILLRLAAPAPHLLLQQPVLEPTFCGAETNVAVALAGFGHRSRLVTALPANPVGEAARQAVALFGTKVQAIWRDGSRMGLYFLEPGAMARPASVIYDRAHSAFGSATPDDYDWAALLRGTDWLFVSGITAALGAGPLVCLQEAIGGASEAGVRIAFDTNYRPALWQGRETEAAAILRELSCRADLLFAGRRATAMMVGRRYDHADPDAGFHAAAEDMFELSPRLQHMAATRREVRSSDRQSLTALLADRHGCSASDTVPLDGIVDRIGTGDAFAAGILHAIDAGETREDSVRFAAACSQWAHSVPGDFLRASLSDIDALARGTGDVRR